MIGNTLCLCCECWNLLLFLCRCVHRIDFLQFIFISCKDFLQSNAFAAADDCLAACCTKQCANLCIACQLQNKCTVVIAEDILLAYIACIGKADIITHCHFQNCFRYAAIGRGISCGNLALSHQTCYHIKELFQALCCRQTLFIIFGLQQNNLMPFALEFGRNDILDAVCCYCEGNQCRRYINMLKGTAHRVLAADCRNFQTLLCHECTQQRRQRLAPTLAVLHGLFKIFLEGKINILKFCTCCHQLCNRFHNCQICTVIRAVFRNEGVIAPCHQRAGGGILLFNGYLIYHSLNGCFLIFTAEGHQNCACADGGVEAFGKPSLGAYIQILRQCQISLLEICGNFLCKRLGCIGCNIDMLFCTVGIQECTGDIYNLLAIPVHHQIRLFCYLRNNGCFEVFCISQLFEARNILCRNNNSHSFLRFGNRKLCAIQTIVFLGNCIQINFQTIRQFADSNRNTACAEVITTLNQLRCFGVAEQSL